MRKQELRDDIFNLRLELSAEDIDFLESDLEEVWEDLQGLEIVYNMYYEKTEGRQ